MYISQLKRLGKQNIWVRDESKNTYGTYKDRRSKFIIAKAKQDRIFKLVLITSGNAGYSLAKFAKPAGIQVVCIVDQSLDPQIVKKLKAAGATVVQTDLLKKFLHPRDIIKLAKENKEKIKDATKGFSEAYESLLAGVKPYQFDYIVCPVGGGEAFIGLHAAIKKRKLGSKLIGIGVKSNPSFADKLCAPWTPYQTKLDAITKKDHRIIKLTESEVKAMYKKYRNTINCEPSSAVVWSVFAKSLVKSTDKILVINSGKGIF